jgi:nucleotide-sensitive chloride channel 1A
MPILKGRGPEPEQNERLRLTQVTIMTSLVDHHSVGDLIVGEEYLVWTNRDQFLAIDYPTIIIHGISGSSDSESFLYCQLSSTEVVDEMGIPLVSDDDTGFEASIELKFFPQDHSGMDLLYQTISDCAALHPDAVEDDNQWITSENVDQFIPTDQEQVLLSHKMALDRLDALINDNGKRCIR